MSSIDYSYRPESYFGKTAEENGITGTSGWNYFRDEINDGDDLWRSRIIPAIMPSGHLPPLRRGEVVIASICLNSVNYDTDYIRARKGKERIRYRYLDEYGGDTTTGKTSRTSIRPLTLGELLDFIFTATSFFEMLEMNFPGELERQLKFFRGESDFYPQFHDALAEKTIEHFFDEYYSDDEESMESLFYSAPHHVVQKKRPSATKTGQETNQEEEPFIRLAPPDDPIYTRGYVIGGYYSNRSSKTTPETASEQKNEPLTSGELYRKLGVEILKRNLEKKKNQDLAQHKGYSE